ncbi:unnamed protein product [Brassicogethes aeneus]|uniref:SCP domain-containing protein n=1 Tax=Brassicogethes aeneus TaxID=1431903 RepID=A0A9P0FJB6_BRAAE|nr:unnamed protein product [Brassicogethes aeneus]
MSAIALLILIVLALITVVYGFGCRGRVMLNGVSEYEKQIILDMHNKMRQSVALGHVGGQPPAANMMEMKWDNELAGKAQQWVDNCQEDHDHNRHVSRFHFGQNIATTWTSKTPDSWNEMRSDFPYAIGKWFEEEKHFRFGGGHGGGITGHYTQMMWATTNKIGCGYAFYYDPSKGYTKNYVCNYGPGGNVIGRSPYQKGNPKCLDFGLQQSHLYLGLCSKQSSFLYDVPSYSHINHINPITQSPTYSHINHINPIHQSAKYTFDNHFDGFLY